MAAPQRGTYIVPSERTARTIGIFNVLFATEILVCVLCISTSLIVTPYYTQFVKSVTQKVEEDARKRSQSELDQLEKDLKKAKTDAQKETIESKMQQVLNRPKPNIPFMDAETLGLGDLKMRVWSISDTVSALILNVMMLISGVGLLGVRTWSRGLAVWTAGLKILRLVLVWSFWCIVIVPQISVKVAQMVGQMFQQQAQAQAGGAGLPGTEFLVRAYSITYTVVGIGMMVFGAIYPAVVIWFLTRPNVKAVFRKPAAAAKPPMEPNGTWSTS
jgi:hypothetical protein